MSRRSSRRGDAPLLSPGEQHAWIEAIVQSADNAIIGKRLDGSIVMWSVGAERLYGYTAEEALGCNIEMLLPSDAGDELAPIFERLRAGEPVEPYDTVRVRKDGSRVHVSLTISPVKNAEGEPIGAWAIARDVGRQRATEAQLRAAKEAAEHASQAKDRFLAVLSHELRTPLTPVLTAIHTLAERDDVPDEVKKALHIIRRNVELESRLIDDLLDLTRISRGKLTLELETSDAAELLRDAVDICSGALKAKRIEVDVRCEQGPHLVHADAARLRQVFWNLLNNAAKFTPEGGKVLATCGSDDGEVVVEVTDTGVGIEEERLARIFDAFEQGLPVQVLRSGGLGLGLAICKALVAMHGGRISAESAGAGTGSTFRVRLPRAAGKTRPHHPTPEERALADMPQPKLQILLVEDHEDSATLMKTLLERSGHTVEVAATVKEALERARCSPPDVIVSDLGLPDGSGIDLLEKLRAVGVEAKAIALSGYGMEEDVRRTREAGFVDHLVKPVGVKRLRQAIAEAARSGE